MHPRKGEGLKHKKSKDDIEEKIKHSFELKEAAKNLLALAKETVEIAIEQSEEKALHFIQEALK